MPLPKTFKDAAEVPDFLSEYYTAADDGSVVLNEGFEIENVGGLRKALGETKTKADKLLKVAKQFGKVTEGTWEFESATDPNEFSELKKKYESLAGQLKDKDGNDIDLDKLVTERVTEQAKDRIEAERANHAKVLAKAQEDAANELKRVQGKLHETSITQAIGTAILKHDGKGKYLVPHVQQMARLDDELNVVLVKPDGNPMMGKDGSNQTVEAYIEELKGSGEWDEAFNAPRATGGGSDGTIAPRVTGGGKPAEPTMGAKFI